MNFACGCGDFGECVRNDGEALSIKVRVTGGGFDRGTSPNAFRRIYDRVDKLPENVEYVPHETGPELLVYVASALPWRRALSTWLWRF
jgi:hypothetical protein